MLLRVAVLEERFSECKTKAPAITAGAFLVPPALDSAVERALARLRRGERSAGKKKPRD
jgi:hypothetical protein